MCQSAFKKIIIYLFIYLFIYSFDANVLNVVVINFIM